METLSAQCVDLDLLQRLTEAPGIAGREQLVTAAVIDEIGPYVDSADIDAIGNVIARKGKSATRLMLECHLDEVGFMVRAIDDDGRVRFLPVGGIEPFLMPGQRLVVHSNQRQRQGTVGYPCGALGFGGFDGAPGSVDDFFIDLGTIDADEVPDIRVGDMITFPGGLQVLHNGQICSKALDDRAAAYVLIECARRVRTADLARQVVFCFSVRHEVGALGVPAAVDAALPHEVIVLDTALAGDYHHGVGGRLGASNLGDGPVLWRGVDLAEHFFEDLHALANENNIPSQCAAWNRPTPTNASRINSAGHAAPVALLSLPLRYPHSPSSVVSAHDLVNAVNLLGTYLEQQQ